MLKASKLSLSVVLLGLGMACVKEPDVDGDGFNRLGPGTVDCDDDNETVFPGAPELCNGRDDDCDGEVDEEAIDAPTWFRDNDGDQYGTTGSTVASCLQQSNTVGNPDDCDDFDSAEHPGAIWYEDRDRDGYGNPKAPVLSCERPVDTVVNDDDCDDENALAHPNYDILADLDGDGYSDPFHSVPSCEYEGSPPAGEGDCDDLSALVHPGAAEHCDGVDEDCDGMIDEDAVDLSTWYVDHDGDGQGSLETAEACTLTEGYSTISGDCDDSDPSTYRGAPEHCDGVDSDCDGLLDEFDSDSIEARTYFRDGDGDGYGDPLMTSYGCDMPRDFVIDDADCDDYDRGVHPGAEELCDGLDNDCDSFVDDGLDTETWYQDLDGDAFGDPSSILVRCGEATGYTTLVGDCDDTDPDIHPSATEHCDGVDEDCDGIADGDDPDLPSDATFYRDADGDGIGASSSATLGCTGASDYVLVTGDCDDSEATVLPGAPTVCADGLVNDCDGDVASEVEACSTPPVDLTIVGSLLRGGSTGDQLGSSLAATGDVDGDGLADFIVGAPDEDTGGRFAGAAYIVPGGWTGEVDPSVAIATFHGAEAGMEFGASVANLGDINGDGYTDVLIGATDTDAASIDTGEACLFLGPLVGTVDSSSADAILLGSMRGERLGAVLTGGEDLNDDGLGDIVIGARTSTSSTGAVYVISGSRRGTSSTADAFMTVTSSSGLPDAADSAGDLDGDGISDLTIGVTVHLRGRSVSGAAFVFYGPTSGSVALSDADAILYGVAEADEAGHCVVGLGDTDGDGLDDLGVGAPGQDDMAMAGGAVYVVHGPVTGTFFLDESDVVLQGDLRDTYAGWSIAAVGDFDLDDVPDILVGGPGAPLGSFLDGGGAFLASAESDGTYALSDSAMFFGDGAHRSNCGETVAGPGDLNGDGRIDLLLGAPDLSGGGTFSGGVYVVQVTDWY